MESIVWDDVSTCKTKVICRARSLAERSVRKEAKSTTASLNNLDPVVLQLSPLKASLSFLSKYLLRLQLIGCSRRRFLNLVPNRTRKDFIPTVVGLAPLLLAHASRGRLALAGFYRCIEFPCYECCLALRRVDPGYESVPDRDDIQTVIITTAVLSELPNLDSILSALICPFYKLHHLFVMNNLVAESKTLRCRHL